MADLIDRQALLNGVEKLIKRITPIEENRDMLFHDSGVNEAIMEVILEVEKAPTIDAVEVVRCKDCKHGRIYCNNDDKWMKCDDLPGRPVLPKDFFCRYGERRADT